MEELGFRIPRAGELYVNTATDRMCVVESSGRDRFDRVTVRYVDTGRSARVHLYRPIVRKGKVFIRDGYITGVLRPRVGTCPVCGQPGQRVIDVAAITMPQGFSVAATIMYNRGTEKQYPAIGLTCGDYAKFHRQVAHITDSRMRYGHAV